MGERRLTIHFTDGTRLAFEFPADDRGPQTVTTRVQELFKDQYMMLEGEGRVWLFPLANIKYIEASPAPEPLPANLIRGARLVD